MNGRIEIRKSQLPLAVVLREGERQVEYILVPARKGKLGALLQKPQPRPVQCKFNPK